VPIVTATNLKRGQFIDYNGDMYRVHMTSHVTSGRGRGHIQSKLRKVSDGSMHDTRLRPDEKIEVLHIDRQNMVFMYSDRTGYTFMNNETFEQVTIPTDLIGDDAGYLTENLEIQVDTHDGNPIGIELPTTVEMEVVETDPGMKTATASASKKPAKTDTGITVNVPQFVEVGTRIKVNTADGSYVDRVK